MQGWRSHGAWARAPACGSDEYLNDAGVRLHEGARRGDAGVPAAEGLEKVRATLRQPGSPVRLVGLSGVGKTRFVQALFDPRVGEGALSPALAVYADVADDPDPQPAAMATRLIAERAEAVLVVDNCMAGLHRRLSELCEGTTLSVVTIEYDIKDGEPEAGDAFCLDVASEELVARLVLLHRPETSEVDAQTIARVSGKNARIALALARTVQRGETLGNLRDEELFRRLFHQRNDPDERLLAAARACSLAYSFDGEGIEGEVAELPRLAALAGQGAQEVFGHVAELLERDLVQRRGVWRAVLPEAIANRLAAEALRRTPMSTIERQLVNGAPARLVRSFSRRLGHLHDSEEAVDLAGRWLAPAGMLADATNLNELGMEMLSNVAPLAPVAVVEALERAAAGASGDLFLARESRHRWRLARLLRSLAYDEALFERCAALLARLAETDGPRERHDGTRDLFHSLFQLYHSGTHATVEQRLRVVEGLLASSVPARQELGSSTLNAMLEASWYGTHHEFDFGARSRDHGYGPGTPGEVLRWFTSAMRLATRVACSGAPCAGRMRAILAERLHGLCVEAEAYDAAEEAAATIAACTGFWSEGWIAIRRIIALDGAGLGEEALGRLGQLEATLRPTDLAKRVEAFALSKAFGPLDVVDGELDAGDEASDAYGRIDALVEELGREVALDEAALGRLLLRLVEGEGSRLWQLGRGLALGSPDPAALWARLAAQLGAAPGETRSVEALRGFVDGLGERSVALAGVLLDEAVDHPVLGPVFPHLQLAHGLDAAGLARLYVSLELARAPARAFRALAYGRAAARIGPADLARLVLAVAERQNGAEVAVEVLAMRLRAREDAAAPRDPEFVAAGRDALDRLELGVSDQRIDHLAGTLVEACLAGPCGAARASALAVRMRVALVAPGGRPAQLDRLVVALFSVQPAAMLDAFLLPPAGEESWVASRLLHDLADQRRSPLGGVSDEAMLGWCEGDPRLRFPLAASLVAFLERPAAEEAPRWSLLALQIIERAPDRPLVLELLARRFGPMRFAGSYASILEMRSHLLVVFEGDPDPAMADMARRERARLLREVEAHRSSERADGRLRDERFE